MLCLDVGNTQIYGGCYNGSEITHRFRINTKQGWSSDQFGVFIRSYLREQDLNPALIKKISICSVVPSINYSIRSACIKYFNIDPFIVQVGIKTGLIVNKYKNPHEIGADIVTGCVGAINLYPERNIIVVDLGTATTIAAVNNKKEFKSGIIMPGMQTQAHSLAVATEKLSSIDIIAPKTVAGSSNTHAIQSGIYYGHLAAITYLTKLIAKEVFEDNKNFVTIGTGGFSILYNDAKIFDVIEPDLLLNGLVIIEKMNS
jgi:type III pantothenate kinase